jgi:hypothetical protein
MEATFGKRDYAKKNYFSQKDGNVIFRIIKPLEQYTKDTHGWAKFHAVIFGYKNSEGKLRPFQSAQVKRDGVVLVECPAMKRIEELTAKLNKAKEEGNDDLVAKLSKIVGYGGNYSVDKNFHMNVIDLQGNIGVLKLRSKAKQALEDELIRLEQEEGVNALSDENGRFFVFNRSGSGNTTSFKVSVYKEKIDVPNVGRVERDVIHKITPELRAKIDREAQDLNKIAAKLTVEEIARIVASADIATGKTPVCDELFDNRWKAEREARGGSNNRRQESAPAASAQTQAPAAAASTPAPATQTAAPTFTAPSYAAPATPAAQAPVTATTPAAPTFAAEQSHEDWLKEIGIDPNS